MMLSRICHHHRSHAIPCGTFMSMRVAMVAPHRHKNIFFSGYVAPVWRRNSSTILLHLWLRWWATDSPNVRLSYVRQWWISRRWRAESFPVIVTLCYFLWRQIGTDDHLTCNVFEICCDVVPRFVAIRTSFAKCKLSLERSVISAVQFSEINRMNKL